MNTKANVETLVRSFVLTGQAAVNLAETRQGAWNTLAPIQFKEHSSELCDGYIVEKGPLLDVALSIAGEIEKAIEDEAKRKSAVNAALTAFRVELNRAFWAFMKWDKDSAKYRVGFKQGTKTKAPRLEFRAVGSTSRTASTWLAEGIKEFGLDEVALAVLGHAELKTAIVAMAEKKG